MIDYEGSVIRADPATGRSFLGSTHLPWVGERTRQPQSAHVRLLSSVLNPVGCKLGPATEVADVARLCELLDPDRYTTLCDPRLNVEQAQELIRAWT